MGRSFEQKVSDAAWEFFYAKEELGQKQKEFDARKKEFYEMMHEYFASVGGQSANFDDNRYSGQLVVKKVESTSIEWDAEKLEKKIDKSVAKQVIKKCYRISDIQGLVRYLKTCGVEPAIFKKFIAVDKTVDEKAVDRLGDTGRLTVRQIAGCYKVKARKPYFTVAVKDSDGGW